MEQPTPKRRRSIVDPTGDPTGDPTESQPTAPRKRQRLDPSSPTPGSSSGNGVQQPSETAGRLLPGNAVQSDVAENELLGSQHLEEATRSPVGTRAISQPAEEPEAVPVTNSRFSSNSRRQRTDIRWKKRPISNPWRNLKRIWMTKGTMTGSTGTIPRQLLPSHRSQMK